MNSKRLVSVLNAHICNTMSASYICPHCGKAVTVKAIPIENCPHCGGVIPDALADEIEKSFVPSRPISLTIQLWFGFIVAFFMLIGLPAAFQPIDDTQLRQIMDMLNMQEMPLLPHLPPLIAGTIQTIGLFFIIWSSYSLYRNEYRSRSLLILMVFVFTVPETVLTAHDLAGSEFGRMMFISQALTCLLCLVAAYWYLYHWKYSKAYYESLLYLESKQTNKESDG